MKTHFFAPKNKTGKAFSLLELMLALIVLAVMSVAIFRALGTTEASAEINREQANAGAIIDVVNGRFAASDSFAGLTTAAIAGSSSGLQTDSAGTGLVSAFDTPILVRAATVVDANDAFDIVYRGLDEKQCLGLVKTLYARSYTVFVDEVSDPTTGAITTAGQQAQATNGANEGRLVPQATLTGTNFCRSNNFKASTGVVSFRFYERKSDAPVTTNACSCSPSTRVVAGTCPIGQAGEITTTFTGTCTGGTAACPLLVETSAITANTCTLATGACAIPAGTSRSWVQGSESCTATATEGVSIASGTTWQVSDSGLPSIGAAGFMCTNGVLSGAAESGATCTASASCVPGTESRTQACAVGQQGIIVETRTSTCATPASAPTWSAWAQVSNSCQTPTSTANPTCVSTTSSRDVGCPVGQYGIIREQMTTTCASPTATPTTGLWIEQYRTCVTNSCQTTGTCCTASTETSTATCPAGQTGSRVSRRDSTCASPSASPVWGAWYDSVNTCTATASAIVGSYCPAGTTWVPQGWQIEQGLGYQEGNCSPYGAIATAYDMIGPAPSTQPTERDYADYNADSATYIQNAPQGGAFGCYADQVTGQIAWTPRGSCQVNLAPTSCGANPAAAACTTTSAKTQTVIALNENRDTAQHWCSRFNQGEYSYAESSNGASTIVYLRQCISDAVQVGYPGKPRWVLRSTGTAATVDTYIGTLPATNQAQINAIKATHAANKAAASYPATGRRSAQTIGNPSPLYSCLVPILQGPSFSGVYEVRVPAEVEASVAPFEALYGPGVISAVSPTTAWNHIYQKIYNQMIRMGSSATTAPCTTNLGADGTCTSYERGFPLADMPFSVPSGSYTIWGPEGAMSGGNDGCILGNSQYGFGSLPSGAHPCMIGISNPTCNTPGAIASALAPPAPPPSTAPILPFLDPGSACFSGSGNNLRFGGAGQTDYHCSGTISPSGACSGEWRVVYCQ